MHSIRDKHENLSKSVDFIDEAAAKGADFVCFPEFQMAFSPASQPARQLASIAESIKGNFITTLSKASKKNRIGVIATIYESSDTPPRVYDTAVILNSGGIVMSVYRKLHLYDALGFKESVKLVAGTEIAKPVKTKAGRI